MSSGLGGSNPASDSAYGVCLCGECSHYKMCRQAKRISGPSGCVPYDGPAGAASGSLIPDIQPPQANIQS